MIEKSPVELIRKSWNETFVVMRKKTYVFLPFAIISFLELISIIMIFIAIQPPLVAYIAPVITRFWGQQFFHYPYNLLLLAQIFNKLQLILAIVLGTFATGVTISLVQQLNNAKIISAMRAIKQTFIYYIHLIILTVIVYLLIQTAYSLNNKILFKIFNKGPVFLGLRREDWSIISIVAGLIVSAFIQALFAFAQQIVMIDGKNFIIAAWKNFRYVFQYIVVCLVLVVLPICLFIPLNILKTNLFLLMKKTTPEIVFALLVAGSMVSLLVNVFIAIATTKLYLLVKQEKSTGESKP